MWRPNYWDDSLFVPRPTEEGFEKGADAMLTAIVDELRSYARERRSDAECLSIHQALDRTIDKERITEGRKRANEGSSS